jgi:hypothetical protein
LAASMARDVVVRCAAHGSRKVGGNDHLESSSARLRFLVSIADAKEVYTVFVEKLS